MEKPLLPEDQHIELIRLAWVNLCAQFNTMGEQLKEFGLLLAAYMEDEEDIKKDKIKKMQVLNMPRMPHTPKGTGNN